MPRKSLRPHLNQIRAWARQGRTDAWVAHQLEVSVRDIEQFKRQNDLSGEDSVETPAGEAEAPHGNERVPPPIREPWVPGNDRLTGAPAGDVGVHLIVDTRVQFPAYGSGYTI